MFPDVDHSATDSALSRQRTQGLVIIVLSSRRRWSVYRCFPKFCYFCNGDCIKGLTTSLSYVTSTLTKMTFSVKLYLALPVKIFHYKIYYADFMIVNYVDDVMDLC